MTQPNPTLDHTVAVACAYLAHHHVAPGAVAEVIHIIHGGLARLAPGAPPLASEEPKASAAEVRKSIKPEGLISFVDGKAYKTLRRHLTAHGMTPAQYRTRFGLPDDYPLVAASYSEQRSKLARAIGLGSPKKPTTSRKAA